MKFTKEQAIKELEAMIPAKDKELDLGRTISEAVDNSMELIGEDSEMELSDFVVKVFKQVKSSIGLTHSENSKVANKMQEQIAQLQKQIDGKQKQKTQEGNDDSKSEDPTIKELMDKLTKMEEKMQRSETENAIAEKRNQLVAKMGESIKDKGWIEDYLKEISITAETDVEAKAKDFVAFYNKTQSGGGRMTPKPTNGNDDAADSYVKSTVAEAAKIKKNLSTITGGSPVRSTTTN